MFEQFAFIALMAVLGLVFGSFANVVVWRLPRDESLSSPSSHCPACEHPIRWYDNVPVVSWLVLGARCRDCGTRISARYPMVEALCGVLFALAGVRWGISAAAVSAAAFFYVLVILTFIDIDTMRLPNSVVTLLAAVGIVSVGASFLVGEPVAPLTISSGSAGTLAISAVLGALLGGGSSLVIAVAYSAVRKVQGFGMGDVKLLTAMGLFLGPYVLLAFFLGSLIGSIVQITLMRRSGRGMSSKFAFGPYLALGGALTALIGTALVQWYLSVLGIT